MADYIRPTPRNPILGLLADALTGGVDWMRDPRRTQQMQGIGGLLAETGIPGTMERLSYGEPLTKGSGMTTRLRPEAEAALMTLGPEAVPIGRGAAAAVRATQGLPVGASIRQVAPQEEALRLAQERAIKLGQSAKPETRMLQQGYEPGWYHGTTGDITRFRSDLLGETTGAQSARKGFFFARDPQNPPEAMLRKSNDPAAIEMLRKLGIPEDEIAKLNTVSMKGYGSETASGYASIGGSREYKEAMRKASAAEKRGDWAEYEKQIQIAEDAEIGRSRTLQGLVAQYGDARDEMLDAIQGAIYSKKLPQDQAELLDQKVKQLMPYGWYNSYSSPQLEALKREIVDLVGEDSAKKALEKISRFQSVKNERNLMERTQEGGNVMPVALRYERPMVYDFEGKPYRDQTYSDLVDQAISAGNDALILRNTYDPGGGPAKLIDVGVVFKPNQIRSRFAAFDPTRRNEPDLLAGALPFTTLLDEENRALLEERLGGLLGR